MASSSNSHPGTQTLSIQGISNESVGIEAVPECTLEVFTCFPNLPPELRQKIWKEGCCVSRNIDLWVTKNRNPGKLNRHPFICRSHSQRPPAILHTTKEAREVGLRYYSLFALTLSPGQIYVHWNCDIICPILHAQDHTLRPYESNMLLDLAFRCGEITRLALSLPYSNTGFLSMFLRYPSKVLEVTIYNALNGSQEFEAEKPVSVNFTEINLKMEEQVGAANVSADSIYELRRACSRAEGYIGKRLVDPENKRPAGWTPPTIKLMLMEMHGI